MTGWRPRLLLFDLDGTLLDSAPDLVRAVQQVRGALGLAPIDPARVRGSVSRGGRAILRAGLPELPTLEAESHLDDLLARYRADICVDTRLFDGLDSILKRWHDENGVSGIVTNKAAWLTLPLLAALGLDRSFAAVVCGDTLEHRKPHPQPVLYACAQSGVNPAETLFLGDDRRDIDAGLAAGARTAAAEWGYLDGEDPAAWGANFRFAEPAALEAWLW